MTNKANRITKEQILETLHLRHNDAAKLLGVSDSTLTRYKKAHGIVIGKGNSLAVDRSKITGRPKTSVEVDITCKCGNTFTTMEYNKTRKYCSHECYVTYREHSISDDTKAIISAKAKSRWESPSQAMLDGIERRKMTDEDLLSFRKYRNRLANLTEKVYSEFIDEINPNRYTRGLAGQEGAYHLDHIISARFGFDNNIPPEVLAEKENLQMLPWRDNITKGANVDEEISGVG